ncbi:MAG: M56 family metallopeptidase [Bacteroidota bacterium]|nr:M56 family metallopeptidase [Bacteroidota bacterium]
MNALLIYMLKTAFYLAGFYVVYKTLLGKDTLYLRNRIYIISSLVFSLILPFYTFHTNRTVSFQIFGKELSEIFVTGNSNAGFPNVKSFNITDAYGWIFIVYITGLILAGFKFILDSAGLMLLIHRRGTVGSHIIRFNGLRTAGFSAFGYIFVNDSLSPEEEEEIIRHEQNHLNHHHSYDILLAEFVMVLQWFNPAAHLLGRSLRAVHEYQADNECLNYGMSVVSYQQLILRQVFKSSIFSISNSFSNPSLIKKRMIMMTKKRSNALANLKLIMVLPVIAGIMFFIAACNKTNKVPVPTEVAPPPPPPPPVSTAKSDSVFTVVDVLPVFPGGDAGILKYIKENVKYPENAKTKGIQGKVTVRFAVETDGSVDNVSILKGVDPELDMEAFRVVQTMPAFEKPGIKDGKAVPVWFMIPINFALN